MQENEDIKGFIETLRKAFDGAEEKKMKYLMICLN